MQATSARHRLDVDLVPSTGPAEARHAGQPLITVDARISRRNRCHIIDWPDGSQPYVTLSLIEAIAQLRLRGFDSCVIRSDDQDTARIRITVETWTAATVPTRHQAATSP